LNFENHFVLSVPNFIFVKIIFHISDLYQVLHALPLWQGNRSGIPHLMGMPLFNEKKNEKFYGL